MVLLDSYSETNQDAIGGIYNGSAQGTDIGETFQANTSTPLVACKFYVKKTGSPTGNMNANLYTLSAGGLTVGTPTGAVLATSDNFDVSTLTTSFALAQLNFSTPFSIVNGTNYAIVLTFTGGDGSNHVQIGVDTSAPTYAGATVDHGGGTWNNNGTAVDTPFYIYGADPTTAKGGFMPMQGFFG